MKYPEKTNQTKKFIKRAKDLECDESEEPFDEALRRVSKKKGNSKVED